MATSDTVVGIVGAVVLTAAMVAVFYYENANVDDRPAGAIGDGGTAYEFRYERTMKHVVGLESNGGTLAPEGSNEHTFTLPPYVWAVNVTVTWTEVENAPGPLPPEIKSGPDEFQLVVLKETNEAMPENPGASRTSPLQMIHVHPGGSSNATSRPASLDLTVFADSEEEAITTVTNETAGLGKHGVGTWKATVTLNDIGENPTASTDTDPGNPYTIMVEIDYWAPVLKSDDTAPVASTFLDLDAFVRRFVSLF